MQNNTVKDLGSHQLEEIFAEVKFKRTRKPLEGQIISSRCPIVAVQVSSPWEVLLDKLIFLSFFSIPFH